MIYNTCGTEISNNIPLHGEHHRKIWRVRYSKIYKKKNPRYKVPETYKIIIFSLSFVSCE